MKLQRNTRPQLASRATRRRPRKPKRSSARAWIIRSGARSPPCFSIRFSESVTPDQAAAALADPKPPADGRSREVRAALTNRAIRAGILAAMTNLTPEVLSPSFTHRLEDGLVALDNGEAVGWATPAPGKRSEPGKRAFKTLWLAIEVNFQKEKLKRSRDYALGAVTGQWRNGKRPKGAPSPILPWSASFEALQKHLRQGKKLGETIDPNPITEAVAEGKKVLLVAAGRVGGLHAATFVANTSQPGENYLCSAGRSHTRRPRWVPCVFKTALNTHTSFRIVPNRGVSLTQDGAGPMHPFTDADAKKLAEAITPQLADALTSRLKTTVTFGDAALLSPAEAADLIKMSMSTREAWRAKGLGPAGQNRNSVWLPNRGIKKIPDPRRRADRSSRIDERRQRSHARAQERETSPMLKPGIPKPRRGRARRQR